METEPVVVATYIVKLSTELEYRMFEASLKSSTSVCDRTYVLYAPGQDIAELPERLHRLLDHYRVNGWEFHRGKVESFAEIRNKSLDMVNEGEFLYWIDADEVGFPQHFTALRKRLTALLAEGKNITQVRTYFTHFCINPQWYERMEPRNTIIKKGPDTRWEGSVHERIVGIPEGLTLYSDYTLHHYGYCKPQEEVFQHWQHYAELEGDPNRYINEEVDGKTVPYFRPVDRPSPAAILEDRKRVLLPYTGEYPDQDLLKYMLEVCPHV